MSFKDLLGCLSRNAISLVRHFPWSDREEATSQSHSLRPAPDLKDPLAELESLRDEAQGLLASNEAEEAGKIFTEILLHYPDSPIGYAGIACVAAQKQDWFLARNRWESARLRFPDNLDIQTGLANALRNTGHIKYRKNKRPVESRFPH